VEFPVNAVMEDRSFDNSWMDGGKPLPVYIGIKKWNPSGENVTVAKKSDSLAQITTRFVSTPDPQRSCQKNEFPSQSLLGIRKRFTGRLCVDSCGSSGTEWL
jgi:hypothetical protein